MIRLPGNAALAAVVFLICAQSSHALPCFPGAQGFGTETPGGRGGRVIAVTNLNDSGPGSFREACTAKGPRTVVFRVGGYIRLKKALSISEPFITIAGQTAPGLGICVRDAVLSIETHDVVMRFMRVRVGPSLVEDYDAQNALEVHGEGCYNIVIDHCTFSWSIDENVGLTGGAHDITFSYNTVSEALRQPFTVTRIGKERSHSMAMILGANPNHCSVHHNLLSHCNSRMPRIQGGTHDFVNNVVYDWGFLTGTFSREPTVNFVGNYYKAGPGSQPIRAIVKGDDMGKVYVKGNRAPQRPADDLPEWEPLTDADPALHRAAEPFPTAPLAITTADQAYEDVMRYAGCRLPALDDTDARVLRQAYLGFGSKIDRPQEVGGYPDLPIAAGPADSDSDGMPDAYEITNGLSPRDAADSSRLTAIGYTNLEVYLNSLVAAWMREPARVVAYPVPDAVTGSPYSVAVNGQVVPVEKAGERQPAYYARFQFTKSVDAVVSIGSAGLSDVSLKPERYRDRYTVNGQQVSFRVSQDGPRIITAKSQGKDLPPLIMIADGYDAYAPPASGPAVFNVRDYGVTAGGVQTVRIQKALDACAARKGGGVVYFGPGVYHTGTIRVGDNTTVYLAPGALIVGSTDPKDYPVDPGRKEEGTHGPVCSFSRLLMFDNCTNSQLTGYGVIDGMGHIVRNKHGRHVQLVDVTGSRNVRIENVVLRNSAEWTLHILGCDRVAVDNVKIINDFGVSNTDGIDPDGSSNVIIRRYLGVCGDDAVAIKTTGNSGLLKPARNIQVEDSVLMTRKTALKLGTETYADIYDVLFRECDVVNSSRGLGLWMRDGSTISNVTFRDITLDLKEIGGEGMSGEPIRATIENRNGVGRIRGVLFDRLHSRAPYRSVFEGMAESNLTDFNFWGCRFTVLPRQIKKEKKPVLEIRNAQDFTFKYAFLHWLTDDMALWDGFIGQSGSDNVFVREIEETRGR